MTNPQRPSTLFIGLGAMGAPMAARLAPHLPLTVFDVDTDRSAEVSEALGAQPTLRAVDAAREVELVILMLPNSRIVEQLLLEQGLLDAMRPGSLLIDMSSSEPASTQRLARTALEREVELVDAPVSGGKAKAATGELTIMVGGTASGKSRAFDVLVHLGTSIVDTGAAGTGHAMKALNNLLSATQMLATSEVLSAGAKFGLAPATMLEVLNHSTGRNQATEVKFAPYVLTGTFDAGFAFNLMVKDLLIAAPLVERAVPEPTVVGAAAEQWRQAQAYLDNAAADHTEIARWVESKTGVELRN